MTRYPAPPPKVYVDGTARYLETVEDAVCYAVESVAPIQAVGTSEEVRRRLELAEQTSPADRRRLLEMITRDGAAGRVMVWLYALRHIPDFEADVTGSASVYRVKLAAGRPSCQCKASIYHPDKIVGCRHLLAAIEQKLLDGEVTINFGAPDGGGDPFERIER